MKWYKLKANNIFPLFFLVLVVSGFAASGNEEQKEKKPKKDKHITDEQKPAVNLSLLIDAKKYEITGDLEKAEHAYRQFIDKHPEIATSYFELARVLATKRELSEAIKNAQKAASLDPDNVWYQLYLAEIQQLNGNTKEAIVIYETSAGRIQTILIIITSLLRFI